MSRFVSKVHIRNLLPDAFTRLPKVQFRNVLFDSYHWTTTGESFFWSRIGHQRTRMTLSFYPQRVLQLHDFYWLLFPPDSQHAIHVRSEEELYHFWGQYEVETFIKQIGVHPCRFLRPGIPRKNWDIQVLLILSDPPVMHSEIWRVTTALNTIALYIFLKKPMSVHKIDHSIFYFLWHFQEICLREIQRNNS